eukprot:gene7126-11289_t
MAGFGFENTVLKRRVTRVKRAIFLTAVVATAISILQVQFTETPYTPLPNNLGQIGMKGDNVVSTRPKNSFTYTNNLGILLKKE